MRSTGTHWVRNPVRIPFPWEGNNLYPLPPDMVQLTGEGARQARVNATRQWLIPHANKKERGEAFAASVRFFDRFYLYPDPEVDFDPMFYDQAPRKTPPFHVDLLRQWGSGDRNLAIAPRGSAKSALIRKAILVRMLTVPKYSIFYATSTKDNVRETALYLRLQFQSNERILADFAPDYPDGRLLPPKGEMPFEQDYMVLNNASRIRLVSAEGRLRGGRPRRFILDDPEYDAKESTEMTTIRKYMHQLIFAKVLPMVMQPDCGVDWLGTFVSRRHYAWHAMQTHVMPDGREVAEDEKFEHWDRLLVRAAYDVPDPEHEGQTKLVSCWPDMWPTEEDKRNKPELANRYSLEQIEEQVGRAVFLSEYMGQPGAGEDAYFGELGPKHAYQVSEIDDLFLTNPRQSKAKVTWEEDGIQHTEGLAKVVNDMRLFMTVDTSYTARSDSDYKVATLMGVDRSNNLWVLDMWAKQATEADLTKNAFRIADRWKCPVIYAEVVKEGISIYNSLVSVVQARSKEMLDVTHLPGIRKLNPGQMRKEDKIAALGLRFEHGKIKLPLWLRNENMWRVLFSQIDEFNPEAADGGLKHDDALDTVSMSMFVVSARSRWIEEANKPKTPMQRLQDGEMFDELGLPIAHGVDFTKLPISHIMPLLDHARKPTHETRA